MAGESYSSGVRFLGIDRRDGEGAARAFVGRYDITYPSLVDDGELLLGLNGVIPVGAIPSTVLIAADGTIAAAVVGPVDYPTLQGPIVDELQATAGERGN